jgi:hypothetical protein
VKLTGSEIGQAWESGLRFGPGRWWTRQAATPRRPQTAAVVQGLRGGVCRCAAVDVQTTSLLLRVDQRGGGVVAIRRAPRPENGADLVVGAGAAADAVVVVVAV